MKFPLFIDIENKDVLVVGAGKIGCRRIKALLDFGARVRVVSKDILDKELIGFVDYRQGSFSPDDIENSFLVIASTDSREVNHSIYTACKERGIYVSVADSGEESSFFFPALCVNDSLTIGIVSDVLNHKLVRDTANKIRGNIL